MAKKSSLEAEELIIKELNSEYQDVLWLKQQ